MREHEDGCGRLRPFDTGGGSGKWRWPHCIHVQRDPSRSGGEPAAFLRPSARQATDRGAAATTAGPHSRAPLSAMSFILHQLISFQTYNSEGRRRRLGGGSEPHSSRRGATEQRSYAPNSLAPITRLPGPVAGGRRRVLQRFRRFTPKRRRVSPVRSLARSVSPVFPFLRSRIDTMKSGSDPFARVRPSRHPSRSDSSSVRPSVLGWQTTQTNRGDRGQTGPGGRAQSRIHGGLR